jgi:HTH-type transcriptional repressor of NAD biosynthesis genes
MYQVGVFPGKFLPPHRGHLNAILRAASQCKKFYVVVSDNANYAAESASKNEIRPMPMMLRTKWLSQELQGLNHIKVVMLDETNIPAYPAGTVQWAALLKKAVPEPFDVIFGGEEVYRKTYMPNFPNVEYVVYDRNRERYPISATEVRNSPLQHWDYILGSARAHFAKRVLITGTESCGKTTLVKTLAKMYHTSWAEELGRFYSERCLGGNESVFTSEDFFKIAFQQTELDEHALKTANKIAFFDTDAVVTQFYCELYLGNINPNIEIFVDPTKYDLTIMLAPNVPWVADGLRWNENQTDRNRLHDELYSMYAARGFREIMVIDDPTYIRRLDKVVEMVEDLLK